MKRGIEYVTERIDNHIESTPTPKFVIIKEEREFLKWVISFVVGVISAFLIMFMLYSVTH